MFNHHIHAALAHERTNAFLAEAQTVRRARQARIQPPSGQSEGYGVQGQSHAGPHHGAVDADVLQVGP